MRNPLLRLTILSLGLFGLAACGPSNQISDPGPTSTSADLTGRAALLSATCSGCHSSQTGAIASLTGYAPDALSERMAQYKSETDGTTVMHRLARGYTDEDIALISAYLGAQKGGE